MKNFAPTAFTRATPKKIRESGGPIIEEDGGVLANCIFPISARFAITDSSSKTPTIKYENAHMVY